MGHGSYSTARSVLHSTVDYAPHVSTADIFTSQSIQAEMAPDNILRECRDTTDHPNTIPIIIALDVTGSMGFIPDYFIREEMTKMMASLYANGHKDAQVLFLGIGDHEYDSTPLQVGQFEADDQLLDKWLKKIYLEGGGGANNGESYFLAWQFAANQTSLDSVEKRNTKGFLFTIGDEPTLKDLPISAQRIIFGDNGAYVHETASSLLKKAMEKYEVYHLHIKETMSGSRKSVQDDWVQLMQDSVKMLDSYKDIPGVISGIISGASGGQVLTETKEEASSGSEAGDTSVPDML